MGTLTLTVPPATEPVTLAEVKEHLRIDGTDSDATLSVYLKAAREWCETQTRRAFINQTWTLKIEEWPIEEGEYEIELPLGPVASISSITYLDTAGARQTLAANQYELFGAGADGIPFVEEAENVVWPATYESDENIVVTFVAGYGVTAATVPSPIRAAILMQVELLYDRNPQTQSLLESARDALLAPYRLVRL